MANIAFFDEGALVTQRGGEVLASLLVVTTIVLRARCPLCGGRESEVRSVCCSAVKRIPDAPYWSRARLTGSVEAPLSLIAKDLADA